jgi:hypothetical protein
MDSVHLVANMGVPMIGIYWPPAWLAFVPVVAVEAWWARRVLGNGWGKTIASTLLANAISTLIGIPLAWFLWATIQLRFFGTALGLDNPAKSIYAVTVQAGWLIPYEKQLWWMVPAAAVVLTVVFFIASVGVEWLVMKCVQRHADPRSLRRWAWKGNVMSYGVILFFVLTFLYIPRTRLDRFSDRPVNFVVNAVYGQQEGSCRRRMITTHAGGPVLRNGLRDPGVGARYTLCPLNHASANHVHR